MKRTIAIFCVVSACLLSARGATVDSDSLRFTLNSNGTATVTNCLYTSTPEISVPSAVSDGAAAYTVTAVGVSAFSGCNFLTTLTLPQTVTSIDANAFYNCTSLASVSWPENLVTIGENAFYGCKSLDEVVLPSSVREIKRRAFYHVMMRKLTLNEGLESIGYEVFCDCDRLRELTLPSTLKTMGGKAFYNCDSLYTLAFPEVVSDLTFDGGEQFCRCPLLSKVTLPRTGMTALPSYMFYDCDALRNIELPSSLVSIDEYAFSTCDSLQTLYLPDGLKAIGKGAFRSCISLRYLRLPEGLETIGEDAITYVEKLQFLNLPSTVTSLGVYAIHTTANRWNSNFHSLGIMGTTMPQTGMHVFWQYQPTFSLLVPAGQETAYQESTSWTPDVADNRVIKGYPAEKLTLTADLVHLVTNNEETYVTGSPEAATVEWFEGMGNYRIYYTDAKGNKTVSMPEKAGEYSISVEFEEGPYYKAASFENVGAMQLYEIADEDFALLYEFYDKTYDRTGKKTTWNGNNWRLVEGKKESAVGIYGVKWHEGHVEEINFGRGTNIFNLNAEETPLSLFRLPQVKKIEMVNVGLYGNISDKVEQLLAEGGKLSPTLEHLDLYNNKLEGNVTTLVAALPALKTVDVSYNQFGMLYPALPETLESIVIGRQTVSGMVATIDLRDITESGFYSTLPTIAFYDPDTRTYVKEFSLRVTGGSNNNTFTLNYSGDNDFNVSGNCTWKDASGDTASCTYDNITTFDACFLYDMGDVDFSGAVNVIDLQQSINYLFGANTYSRFNFFAADLKADDVINVLDIVRHVDILLAKGLPTVAAGAKAAGTFAGQDIADDAEASLYQAGGKLVLRTARPVAAIDMVVNGAPGTVQAKADNGMTVASRTHDDGTTHLVVYSASGKMLPVGESIIATGVGESTVCSATLVDGDAEEVSVTLNNPAATVTKVGTVGETQGRHADGAVYGIGGQRMNPMHSLPKGIYIINGEKKMK